MSFTDASESFFLDAAESTTRPFVQILPLNDTAVFDYLDAHPDVLSKYLRERSDLSQYFRRTSAQNNNTHGEPAFENATSPTVCEQAALEASDDVVQEFARRQAMVIAQPLDEEGDVYMDLYNEGAGDCCEHGGQQDHHEHQGHPEHEDLYEEHREQDDDSDIDRGEDSNGDEDGSWSNDDSENDSGGEINANAVSNDVSSEAGRGTSLSNALPTPASDNGGDECDAEHNDDEEDEVEELIPYPAPASLVAASLLEPPTRTWALWEQEACIRHMLDIDGERRLKGEARFREALRRMQLHDGVRRTGYSAVKNFWNRVGRARSRFDERRNKKAPLATSKQGSRASHRRNG
ncbi:hypothetical protein AYL99_02873 [Fonsecaea erecta]|uniref:Uncharacterized protein n=1 Tax=Fonsecaea erecta TaxID=1367422 RepID=A0A178ZW39_9EURO|nr:hypothetical protein AYL99_02873 [Fonsecaea erecta]OAP63646.1 hypothetical protein AYL99_02873 [Fonsecaea erecta]